MGHDHDSRVIPANEYVRSRWRNGAGWTREICAMRMREDHGTEDASDGDWDWRLSIADIESRSGYSAFPGTRREQVLLRGDALDLEFPEGDTLRLAPPFGRLRFEGDRCPEATPTGHVEVLNLIWRPRRVVADVWHRPLVGPMLFFAEPDTCWALHLLAGQARFAKDGSLPPLAQGDTALLLAPQRRRFLLDGGGELLVVRLQRPG